MVITKIALPRRTFIRGMGATLALPLLDAMVPAMSAQRQGGASVRGDLLRERRQHERLDPGHAKAPVSRSRRS